MPRPDKKYKVVRDTQAWDGQMQERGSFAVRLEKNTILFFDDEPRGQNQSGQSRSGNTYYVDASDLEPAGRGDDRM